MNPEQVTGCRSCSSIFQGWLLNPTFKFLTYSTFYLSRPVLLNVITILKIVCYTCSDDVSFALKDSKELQWLSKYMWYRRLDVSPAISRSLNHIIFITPTNFIDFYCWSFGHKCFWSRILILSLSLSFMLFVLKSFGYLSIFMDNYIGHSSGCFISFIWAVTL